MSKALEIVIETVLRGSSRTHTLRIVSQQFTSSMFGKGRVCSDQFTASNGFVLRSVDMPEVRQKHAPSERSHSRHFKNTLFVRGSNSYANDRIVAVTSLSYILELRIAIKEYNAQFNEGCV